MKSPSAHNIKCPSYSPSATMLTVSRHCNLATRPPTYITSCLGSFPFIMEQQQMAKSYSLHPIAASKKSHKCKSTVKIKMSDSQLTVRRTARISRHHHFTPWVVVKLVFWYFIQNRTMDVKPLLNCSLLRLYEMQLQTSIQPSPHLLYLNRHFI